MNCFRGLPLIALLVPLHAQTQIGGGTCNTATVNGTYFYLLSGSLAAAAATTPANSGRLRPPCLCRIMSTRAACSSPSTLRVPLSRRLCLPVRPAARFR